MILPYCSGRWRIPSEVVSKKQIFKEPGRMHCNWESGRGF